VAGSDGTWWDAGPAWQSLSIPTRHGLGTASGDGQSVTSVAICTDFLSWTKCRANPPCCPLIFPPRQWFNLPPDMMITVKEAVIVSIIVESVLYGKSFRADSRVERSDNTSFRSGVLTFLFGVAVWALTYQRTSAEIVRLVLGAAFLLFVLGTMVRTEHLYREFQHGSISRRTPSTSSSMPITSGRALLLQETPVHSSKTPRRIPSRTYCT
jgi:hypothetical protein